MATANRSPEIQSNGSGSPSSPAGLVAEEPYSIFDKRQKAVIVIIVSLAATCMYKHK